MPIYNQQLNDSDTHLLHMSSQRAALWGSGAGVQCCHKYVLVLHLQ